MIFEVMFWIAFIAASQTIARIYYRRRDVPYGPHRSRRSKAGDWGRQNSINGIPRAAAGAGIYDVRRSLRSIAPREVGKKNRPIPEVCELPE
jgi:hypothetical protein